MIETFCKTLIEELGATGILILALALIGFLAAKEISRPIKIINKEIGEIRDVAKEALIHMKK